MTGATELAEAIRVEWIAHFGFDQEPTYEQSWSDFWLPIVFHEDGELNLDQVKRELHDWRVAMHQVALVYDHVTGGLLSKPNYLAPGVIEAADEHLERVVAEALSDQWEPFVAFVDAAFEVEYEEWTTDQVEEQAFTMLALVARRRAAKPERVPTSLEPVGEGHKRIPVTVSVHESDIRAVIAWAENDDSFDPDPKVYRLLAMYRETTDAEKKKAVFLAMEASLQWCVFTLDEQGVEALRALLPKEKSK